MTSLPLNPADSPLFSPHAALAAQQIDTLPGGERRTDEREAVRLQACLMPLSGADDIRCQTDNLSPQGVLVTVPVGFGIAVGQRYQVELAAPGASLGMGPLLIPSGTCATVVHARVRHGAASGEVAVGLRFDNPIPV